MINNSSSTSVDEQLQRVAAVYRTNTRWLRVRTADYFGTLDFTGQKVLDIGAGTGLYACSVATLGASQVIALEPEQDGSRQNVAGTLRLRAAELNLSNVEVYSTSIEDYQPPAQSFDLIYMLAVINHLDEKHVQTLHISEESKGIYQQIFQRVFNWLKPGGTLVVTDASRHHAYESLIKLHILNSHPFHPHIEWEKHQPPKVWKEVLERVGFTDINIRWATNWRYPWMPKFLTDNPLAAYIYSSLFILSAHRPLIVDHI